MKLTERKKQTDNMGPLAHPYDISGELWRVDWKAWGYPYCGIYAISPDNRWPTKIGFSQLPSKRLVSLQVSCWKRLDVAGYAYCTSVKDARALEMKVHETLKSESLVMHGEWFDIKPDKAMEVVSFNAMVMGIELRTDVPDERVEKALDDLVGKMRLSAAKAETDEALKNTRKPARVLDVLPRVI